MAGERPTGEGRGGNPRPRRGTGRPASSEGRPARHLRADRDERERPRSEDLPIPDVIEFSQLDRSVRQRLRTLSKMNAEDVGRHLIMVGLLLEDDPELAYRHALVAVARAGRVDVVREAAGLAAYATGRYADALRELRTVRRLSGSSDHLAVEADCERGLGRPERALALAKSPEGLALAGVALAELHIVVAGARVDLGDLPAALQTLERIKTDSAETEARVSEAKVDVLRALGRKADADALAASLPIWDEDDGEIVVYDAEDDGAEDAAAEDDAAEDGAAEDGAAEDGAKGGAAEDSGR